MLSDAVVDLTVFQLSVDNVALTVLVVFLGCLVVTHCCCCCCLFVALDAESVRLMQGTLSSML